MDKKIITTEKAPGAVATYSQSVQAGELLFVSGQIGLSPETGKFVGGGIEEQTRQTLNNLLAILEAAGTTKDKLVKCTVLLADIEDFKAMNKVYAEFFPENPPARAAFAAAGLPLGALVEIDGIAIVD